MAADSTYPPGVNYEAQGGQDWVVQGSITLCSTATIDMSTGGTVKHYVETGTTTANLKPYGLSTLYNSSAAGQNVYTLDPPIKGVPKYLAVLRTDSTDSVRVELSGATLLATTGATNNALVWATSGAGGLPPGGVTLMGASTSTWAIVGSIGTIATTS